MAYVKRFLLDEVQPQQAIAYRDALRRLPVGSMMPWTSSIGKAVAKLEQPAPPPLKYVKRKRPLGELLPSGEWVAWWVMWL